MTTSQSLYEIGTHIDLSYINRTSKVSTDAIQSVVHEFSHDTEFEPGTFLDLSFIGRQVNVLSALVSQTNMV